MTVATVLSGPERRRRWTAAEKLRIVEECLASGAMASEVARRHGIHPNQLYNWRRQARLNPVSGGPAVPAQKECRLVPIAVAAGCEIADPRRIAAAGAAVIELVLRNGRLLRLPEGVSPAPIADLADALEGAR
jgi:transposase